MKKNILVFTIMLVCVFSTQAQINIIPKVGINFAGIGYVPHPQPSNGILLGMQIGVATEITINNKFSIQPELLYTQKGNLFIGDQPYINNQVIYFSNYTKTIRLHYLEIPVLAKMKFGKGNFKFYLGAGFSTGMALAARKTTDSDLPTSQGDIKIGSGRRELKRFDVGWQAAMGFVYKKFVLDLRYGQGFTNTFNEGSGYSKSQNKVFGATLGYIIPFKLK